MAYTAIHLGYSRRGSWDGDFSRGPASRKLRWKELCFSTEPVRNPTHPLVHYWSLEEEKRTYKFMFIRSALWGDFFCIFVRSCWLLLLKRELFCHCFVKLRIIVMTNYCSSRNLLPFLSSSSNTSDNIFTLPMIIILRLHGWPAHS